MSSHNVCHCTKRTTRVTPDYREENLVYHAGRVCDAAAAQLFGKARGIVADSLVCILRKTRNKVDGLLWSLGSRHWPLTAVIVKFSSLPIDFRVISACGLLCSGKSQVQWLAGEWVLRAWCRMHFYNRASGLTGLSCSHRYSSLLECPCSVRQDLYLPLWSLHFSTSM